MEARTRMIVYGLVCLLIGGTCATLYYYPEYEDMRIQRNGMAQELCNSEYAREGLEGQLIEADNNLVWMERERDNLREQLKGANEDHDARIDEMEDALRESYRQGYDDGSTGEEESGDDFFWKLIGILF